MRVYVVLDITGGSARDAARLLRHCRGVSRVDVLEGPPDIVITVEAPERDELARMTLQALESVESMTSGVSLLPVQPADNFEKAPLLKRHPGIKTNKAAILS